MGKHERVVGISRPEELTLAVTDSHDTGGERAKTSSGSSWTKGWLSVRSPVSKEE